MLHPTLVGADAILGLQDLYVGLGSLLLSTLARQSLVEALDQGRSVDRLAQEGDRACVHRSRPDGVAIERGDEDERRAAALRQQHALELNAAQSRQLNVGDYTRRIIQALRTQKIFSARICAGGEAK